MKKGKLFKKLSVVAVALALITTTVLAGTMAKYTTTTTATQEMTVAKWAFAVNESAAETFNISPQLDTVTTGTVADGMIAPGRGATFTVKATNPSDVKANYTVKIAKPSGDNFANIVLKYGNADGAALTVSGNDWVYEFGEGKDTTNDGVLDINDTTGETLTIYVEWPYTTTGEGKDAIDTAAGAAGGASGTKFTLTVTVVGTQVDPSAN